MSSTIPERIRGQYCAVFWYMMVKPALSHTVRPISICACYSVSALENCRQADFHRSMSPKKLYKSTMARAIGKK
ncbi:hypothetical protein [Rhizobium sp. R339]|uniref:hypothetical protein n=1 Tax=Rhizobium sp. R339 TaxID=1764273 RepID=UPI00167EDC7B|nr:hypothetical protein [Rhizobium sp. R339]